MPESAYLPTVHGLTYGACSLRTTTFDGCEADETTIRLIDDRRAKTPLPHDQVVLKDLLDLDCSDTLAVAEFLRRFGAPTKETCTDSGHFPRKAPILDRRWTIVVDAEAAAGNLLEIQVCVRHWMHSQTEGGVLAAWNTYPWGKTGRKQKTAMWSERNSWATFVDITEKYLSELRPFIQVFESTPGKDPLPVTTKFGPPQIDGAAGRDVSVEVALVVQLCALITSNRQVKFCANCDKPFTHQQPVDGRRVDTNDQRVESTMYCTQICKGRRKSKRQYARKKSEAAQGG